MPRFDIDCSTFDSGVSFFFYGVREVLGKDNKFIDFLETAVMVALVADAVMGLMSIGESVIKLGTKVLTKVSKVENVLDLVKDTAKVAKKVGEDIVKGAKGLIKNLDNTVDDVLSLVGGSKRKLAFAGVADDVGDVTSGLRSSDVVGDAFRGTAFSVADDSGSIVNDVIPWSDKYLSKIAKELENGVTQVTVKNRSQAEELFLRIFQGQGYRNVTGMDGVATKQFFGSKAFTYHWDDILDETGRVLGHALDNADGAMKHLQISPEHGSTIRIFFN